MSTRVETGADVAAIRIGTWNLENLFRPGGQAGPATATTFRAELDALTAVIAGLDPDVLAVQEVGDPAALDDLADRLDGGYDHRATAAPDGRGIRVGFLSRLPLRDLRQISDFPSGLRPVQVDDTPTGGTAMGRPALVAAVDVAGAAIELLTCHLKSKLLTFPGGRFATTDEGERARFAAYALNRRAAEAVTVRAAVTRVLGGHGTDRRVLLLGDLNDEPTAETTQILNGPPGSEIGTVGFDRPDRGGRPAAVEPRGLHRRRRPLQPHPQRPSGAHRPHPGLARPPHHDRAGQDRGRAR